MRTNTLKVLKAYLQLPAEEKLKFLHEVMKIEKMHTAVKSDYEKTLLSIPV